MHFICVCGTRYDTTYIYDRYYIRTHVYVFVFSVRKKLELENALYALSNMPVLLA